MGAHILIADWRISQCADVRDRVCNVALAQSQVGTSTRLYEMRGTKITTPGDVVATSTVLRTLRLRCEHVVVSGRLQEAFGSAFSAYMTTAYPQELGLDEAHECRGRSPRWLTPMMTDLFRVSLRWKSVHTGQAMFGTCPMHHHLLEQRHRRQ